jgi:hypothetical protein
MKIKIKDMQRIIKEEVEKQKEKIIQIALDACPCPEVDPKKEVEELPDFREEDVDEALEALDEEQLKELIETTLEEDEELVEKIAKVDGGYVVKHCSGKDKGKRIAATPKPVSKKKAQSIHKAIMANKGK